ncbi:MAG: endonuclease/exonuclease/phosphatase family protein [Muribaculaceae bacterium]
MKSALNYCTALLICCAMWLTSCGSRISAPHTLQARAQASIATFNMRCDVPEDDSGNNWTYRRHRIAHYIDSIAIDVVASQELVGNQDSTLLCLMPGYGEVRAGNDGVNVIFYSRASIEVVAQGCFSLSESPDSVMKKGWDAAYPRRAVWAVMRHRSSGKQFVIINTHLDHIGAVSRREGAKLIVQRISAISHGLPTVVTGDFNVEADSEAYAILTSGGLCDAQKTAQTASGASYTWHNFGRLDASKRTIIDFVLITPDITAKHCHIPHPQAQAMLSDHSPLIANLEF